MSNRMIRVDHAGEYGAVRIYEGQLAVLEARTGSRDAAATIRKMAQQEQHHLETFDKLIVERRVRPTALEPIWRIAGFALGAATALMGEKAAMACTAAVEEVIDEHYARRSNHWTAIQSFGEPWRVSAPRKSNIVMKRWRAAPNKRPATVF